MPYVKRKRYGRGKTAKGAKLSPKQKNEVKQLMARKLETKYVDTTHSSTSIPVGGAAFGPLSLVGQGIASNQRTGDHINSKYMEVNQSLIVGDATNFVRVLWFQWKPNSATSGPSVGALLQNPAWPVESPVNDVNKTLLFVVLSDKTYAMSQSGANACIRLKQKFYGKRLGDKGLQFNPAANTGFNHIYCYVFSDSVAAPNPSTSMYVRYAYTDA